MVIVLALLAALSVPPEVKRFVPEDRRVIDLAKADLDRDGRDDYILALDRIENEDEPDRFAGEPREVRILTRQPNGKLKLAGRGPKAIFCRGCGGVMGDPLFGFATERGRFTIRHMGGAGWRWTADFTFAWSRRDQTWQLVRVEKTEFHAGEPEKVKKTVQTPPKDFGKIDLREFDAERWQ